MSKLDIATLPTDTLPVASDPISPEPDPAIAHLDALFSRLKEDQQLIAAQDLEIKALHEEIARLRRGEGIQVIIDGHRLTLGSGLVTPPAVEVTNGHKSGVEDSFVL